MCASVSRASPWCAAFPPPRVWFPVTSSPKPPSGREVGRRKSARREPVAETKGLRRNGRSVPEWPGSLAEVCSLYELVGTAARLLPQSALTGSQLPPGGSRSGAAFPPPGVSTAPHFFHFTLDKWSFLWYHTLCRCECSSSGRAPPCQGGGSEFEPRHSLHSMEICLSGYISIFSCLSELATSTLT